MIQKILRPSLSLLLLLPALAIFFSCAEQVERVFEELRLEGTWHASEIKINNRVVRNDQARALIADVVFDDDTVTFTFGTDWAALNLNVDTTYRYRVMSIQNQIVLYAPATEGSTEWGNPVGRINFKWDGMTMVWDRMTIGDTDIIDNNSPIAYVRLEREL